MNTDPQLSSGGVWIPVPTDELGPNTANGSLDQTFAALIPLGASGAYGLVVTGWGSRDPSTAYQVSTGILAPTAGGGVTFDTQDYIANPLTDGGGSIIVADFNGDGSPDIVIVPHNEGPFVPVRAFAHMSDGRGGFTTVALPGELNAPSATLANINGQLAVITATFQPGDQNPIYTYSDGQWVEHLSTSMSFAGWGESEAIDRFGPGGAYELVRGGVGEDYTSPGVASQLDIAVYGFQPDIYGIQPGDTIPQPTQLIIPYLSTLPQYQSGGGFGGNGLSQVYGMWDRDLNNDGKPDLLVAEDMYQTGVDFPTALQILINNGDGTFKDATASLNPNMSLNTDDVEDPEFFATDNSGIDNIAFSAGTDQGASRQANYLLLNDGTGHLYVALHDQFDQLETEVVSYLEAQYPASNGYLINDITTRFSKFIALPQADGSVNYVAQYLMSHFDATSGLYQNQYAYVNIPLAYNPAKDFTQDVAISDRNSSTKIRTWAGNDTISDTNGGADCHIDCGLGLDTCVYSASSAQSTVSYLGNGTWTVKAGADGLDTLVNIEVLKFADRTMDLVAKDNLSGHFVSDILIENSAGAVVVGEIGASRQEAYARVSGLGSEWGFRGTGDFLGDGQSDFLIENAHGAVDVGEVRNGKATYVQVGGLGSEWSFRGAGDFLDEGHSQFLIENTAGAVFVGDVRSGRASYTQVTALGSEWKFVGAGDFLGDGKDQFLIENSKGAIAVGELGSNDKAAFTQVAALGLEWKFEGAGDFLGDGKAQFLIENAAGEIYVGEVDANHRTAFTKIGALGPEWKFVGVGDYGGTGRDGFLIENANGALDLGTIVGGKAQYAQIGALGPEWSFRG